MWETTAEWCEVMWMSIHPLSKLYDQRGTVCMSSITWWEAGCILDTRKSEYSMQKEPLERIQTHQRCKQLHHLMNMTHGFSIFFTHKNVKCVLRVWINTCRTIFCWSYKYLRYIWFFFNLSLIGWRASLSFIFKSCSSSVGFSSGLWLGPSNAWICLDQNISIVTPVECLGFLFWRKVDLCPSLKSFVAFSMLWSRISKCLFPSTFSSTPTSFSVLPAWCCHCCGRFSQMSCRFSAWRVLHVD